MAQINYHKTMSDVDYGSIPNDSFHKATILDQMDPLVFERENANQKKRLGVLTFLGVLFVAIAGTTAFANNYGDAKPQNHPESLLENRFASLLVDDKAFYFPSTNSGDGRHRSLEATDDSTNPWALAWADNKDSFAAVGAYYRAKGKAIAHYYKSSYDPKYNKTAEEAGVANVTLNETAPWTFDWKIDPQAGIALAQKYKSIGDAIDEHYQQAFDPTFTSDDGGRRYLRALSTADEGETTPPAYDWASDRDRGIAIGQHFKELSQQIKEHYQQQFGELANAEASAPVDWSATWTDFKAKGQAIGKYYQNKGVAIARFYEQQQETPNSSETASSRTMSLWRASTQTASIASDIPTSSNADTAANVKNDWYVWGMDWQNEKDKAMNLHEEMKSKGQAIADFYRAKFDPTFFTNAAELVSNSLDNLSFPSWGEDTEADKARGKEIGEYWASHGKMMGKEQKTLSKASNDGNAAAASSSSTPGDFWKDQGEAWKERGQNIGKYWEGFYRSRFDPTYDAEKDFD